MSFFLSLSLSNSLWLAGNLPCPTFLSFFFPWPLAHCIAVILELRIPIAVEGLLLHCGHRSVHLFQRLWFEEQDQLLSDQVFLWAFYGGALEIALFVQRGLFGVKRGPGFLVFETQWLHEAKRVIRGEITCYVSIRWFLWIATQC